MHSLFGEVEALEETQLPSPSSPACIALILIETWIVASKRRRASPSLSGESFEIRISTFFLSFFALSSQTSTQKNKKTISEATAPTPWSFPGPPQRPPKPSRCSRNPLFFAAARGRSCHQEKKMEKKKMSGRSGRSPGGTRRGGCWSARPRPLPSRSPTVLCSPSSSRPLAREPRPPWPRCCRCGRRQRGCRPGASSRRSPISLLPCRLILLLRPLLLPMS